MTYRKNFTQPIFIVFEIIVGFGFGALGSFILSFNSRGHIMSSILNSFVGFYLFMIVGIGIVGHFHLKQLKRTSDFWRAIGFSFIGLIGFLILYIGINALIFSSAPYFLSSVFLPIAMPVLGAVLGFNYLLRK